MCKLVQALEGTSIFVSTLSIIAIALDRYNVILRSVSPDQHRRTTVVPIFLKLILIWIIGIILSMPLFLVRTVESHYIGMYILNESNELNELNDVFVSFHLDKNVFFSFIIINLYYR